MNIKTVMLVGAAACAVGTGYAKGGFFRQLVNQTVDTILAPPPPPPPPPPTVVVQQPVYVQQPVVQQPVYVQQQPVVQQPVVQQPVQQPVQQVQQSVQPIQQVQQPVQQVQQSAEMAPQAPAAAVAAVAPAVDASTFAQARTTAADAEAPEFKYGTLYFKKPATPEQIASVKSQVKDPSNLTLSFKETVDDATVAAAIVQFPECRRIDIRVKKSGVTTIAPLALLRNARQISLNDLKKLDLSPLTGLPNVETLEIRYCQVDDLSPAATLPKLKELDAYGSELVSFAPLAAAPRLEKVNYYAAVLSPEGWETLGLLKQVKDFHGGLTKMTSVAWCRNVPQLESIQIFAEKISDLTPIATLTNMKYFRGWNMRGDNLSTDLGDLSFLANSKMLERLELPGCKYSSTAVLAGLPAVKTLNLDGAKAPIDLSFVKQMPVLTSLSIQGENSRKPEQVVNFEALTGHPTLESINLVDVTGPTSLAVLQSCPKLRSVTVRKGVFPAEEIAALNAQLQAKSKWCKVSER